MDTKRNNLLALARHYIGATQKEMAELIEVTTQTYWSYESGNTCPSKKIQTTLAVFFVSKGVDLLEEDLFPERKYESSQKYDFSEVPLGAIRHYECPAVENEFATKEFRMDEASLVERMLNYRKNFSKKKEDFLTVQEKSVIKSFYLEGKTLDEVADEFKINKNAVVSIKQEGIEKLRSIRHNFLSDLNNVHGYYRDFDNAKDINYS